MGKVKISITEKRYHEIEIDLSAYDESVTNALKAEDGEFFGDFCCEVKTLKDGEFEFEDYTEVPPPL